MLWADRFDRASWRFGDAPDYVSDRDLAAAGPGSANDRPRSNPVPRGGVSPARLLWHDRPDYEGIIIMAATRSNLYPHGTFTTTKTEEGSYVVLRDGVPEGPSYGTKREASEAACELA